MAGKGAARGELAGAEAAIAYFEGEFRPLADARVNVMTHAFLYGTATFEGVRAYWNAEDGQLYALKLREHLERLRSSCKILLMDPLPDVDALEKIIIELLKRNNFKEDVYVRPSVYKSTAAIGVRLHNLQNDTYVVALPFGDYIDTASGIRCATVSTRRTSDLAIPARAKVVGNYVNSAFSKSEAGLNGFDEGIVLTESGKVSEGSAENIFMVRGGALVSPGVNDDILEGITRAGIMEIAAELGVRVVERQIDRSELYIADEIFLVGTGAQVSPVIEVDHRKVGTGEIGAITRKIQDRYFDAVRGKLPQYRHWVTPIY
ncbi:MAG: branched-chain amino acid transaminase [Chloroflexi bacterium]|jgi:branched-chain amino acid aminotransferase|nr:MAG: branched-chain amino acid transaminase [Chloroflexota bacterium]RLT29510.1 MAG: branched-chain amino acid transaminase [Chloroflexota bacterium]